MPKQQKGGQETSSEKQSAVIRNERMTALAGAVIFVIILSELVITANMRSLVSAHIFVGIVLCGPIIAKLSSTGYRFFRYHTKSPSFVNQARPHFLLRVLAPLVILSTLTVVASGITMVAVGPAHAKLFFKIHTISIDFWLPLLAVHVWAHIRNVPRLVSDDWSGQVARRATGRGVRLLTNIGAIILGLIAALVMIPFSAPWYKVRTKIPPGVPSKLVTAVIIALFAVLIVAIPIRYVRNKRAASSEDENEPT